MDDSSKNSKSFLEQLDEYIKKNRPASGAVRASKEKMYSGLFDEADVLRDVISKSASETEKNQKVLDDILKRASDIYEKKRGQAASSLAESDKIVRDSALAKSHVEDLVRQQSKSPSLDYLSEAEKMGKQIVPQGSPYDPASLKRKAAEAAAKISSEGKLPGTINLPGPDEVKDLVPTSGGPIQTVGQAAKNIGEDVIEAQYRNIPSFADKARGFGTKASPVLKSGLSGAATSVLTGGLYDTDQEAKQEEIRSGKRDIPHPDKPGYVFRGSDIVKAGSESPVAADVLPSMSDIFKRALAPAGSEAQMEAYKNIRKTGYGQLIHGREEIPTDSDKSPSTLEKAKNFLSAMFGSTDEKQALEQPASEKDKEEVERLIRQEATRSSIQPKKEAPEDEKQFKTILAKPVSAPSEEEGPSEAPKKEKEEKPPVLAKEEKSSLEKMLSDAASKDLEERKKYSDLLKDAIAKRDFTQLAAQLGRAASQIGAGITGTVERGVVTKPVGGEIYDKMMDIASQPISDLEKMKAVETEERKNDPKSSESMAARAIMTEFGIKIPETATAAFLEKQFPAISSLMTRREAIEQRREASKERAQEMSLRRQELAIKAGQIRDEKTRGEFVKLQESLDPTKARSGAFGDQYKIVNQADRLKTLLNKAGSGMDLTAPELEEVAIAQAKIIGGAGGTSRSQIQALVPHSLTGEVTKVWSWLSNNPTGTKQQEFVKRMAKTIDREQDLARGELKKIIDKRMTPRSHLKEKDPQLFKQILDEAYGSVGISEKRGSTERDARVQKYADEHFGGNYDNALQFLESRGKK